MADEWSSPVVGGQHQVSLELPTNPLTIPNTSSHTDDESEDNYSVSPEVASLRSSDLGRSGMTYLERGMKVPRPFQDLWWKWPRSHPFSFQRSIILVSFLNRTLSEALTSFWTMIKWSQISFVQWLDHRALIILWNVKCIKNNQATLRASASVACFWFNWSARGRVGLSIST